MQPCRPVLLTTLVTALGLLAPGPSSNAQDPPPIDSEALGVARQLTEAGAKLFVARDAKGLTDTYADDGQIVLVEWDAEVRGLKLDARSGRSAVLDAYQQLFQGDQKLEATNIIQHARFLGPNLLQFSGVLVLKVDNQTQQVPFTQLRIKHGPSWLISKVEIFVPKQD